MAPKRRSLITAVSIPSFASQYLLQWAMDVQAQLASGARDRKINGGNWQHLQSEHPIVPYPAQSWKTYVGGLLCAVRVPKLDGTGYDATRATVVFNDPQIARAIFALERSWIRGALHLIYIEGQWYARVHFRSTQGLKQVPDKRGHPVWRPKRAPRRWHNVPVGWPLDKYGKPISDAAMKRRHLWPFTPGAQTSIANPVDIDTPAVVG